MRVLTARNPDHGLGQALDQVLMHGIPTDSRNGPVLRFPTPVTTVWEEPLNRVSFAPIRDANPFLHLMEAMWMLAGRNDVATMGYYAKQMFEYSDDGETLNAAYGHRWRNHFGHNQLDEAVEILKGDPASRQVVVQIWDHEDLTKRTKDKACNTQAIFDIVNGRLNMTICNRSNDIIWGCYGANVVHFSFLLEYMANRIGVPVGTYYQVSNNLHLYTEFEITKRFIIRNEDRQAWAKPYRAPYAARTYPPVYFEGAAKPLSLGATNQQFEEDLQAIVSGYAGSERILYASPFLNGVVEPMRCAYVAWKDGAKQAAYDMVREAQDEHFYHHKFHNDWLLAGKLWMERRLNKETQA